MKTNVRNFLLAVGATLLCVAVIYFLQSGESEHDTPVRIGSARTQFSTTTHSPRAPSVLTTTISGKIVDKRGRIVANSSFCSFSASRSEPACSPAPEGVFQVELPSEGVVSFVASAEGYTSLGGHGSTSVRLEEATNETIALTLVLESAEFAIKGVVYDVFGGIVEGALVHPVGGGDWLGFATTDTEGEFTVWLAESKRTRVHVQAEGYSDAEFVRVPPASDIDVVLEPTATLAGRVVERTTGSGVPGATVFASPASLNESGRRIDTDGNGSFRLTGLRPGRYRPRAEAPGLRGVAEESYTVGVGQTMEEILIETDSMSQVHARILTTDDRSPVEAVVFIRANSVELRAETDADGAIDFPAVWPGNYEVEIRANGRICPASLPLLSVEQGENRSVEWVCERGGSIAGTVIDPQGKPIEKAIVRAWFPDSLDEPNSRMATYSGEGGRFVLEGVVSYGGLRLQASHQEYIHKIPLELEHSKPGTLVDVTVTLDPASVIEGAVLDGQGAPASRAIVLLNAEGGSSPARQARVDSLGNFTFGELVPGVYRLVAGSADRSAMNPPEETKDNVATIVLSAGDRQVVELEILSWSDDIQGIVTDYGGGGRSGAVVTIQSQRDVGFLRRTTTGDDGRFRFESMASDRYVIRAYDDADGRAEEKDVRAGADVELKFQALSSICGRVEGLEDAEGEYWVRISGERNFFNINESFPARQRRWCVRGIVPGKVTVLTRYKESSRSDELVLTPGGESEVVFLPVFNEDSDPTSGG